MPGPIHFRTAAAFRRWLDHNHATRTELWVRFYKKDSGKGGMSYSEAVEEALCYGWIDGLLRSEGAASHIQRFTPRRRGSIWSNVNVAHVERLKKECRMHAAGLAAYALRDPKRTGIYSFEKPKPKAERRLPRSLVARFKARPQAWEFFSTQAPWYRRWAVDWINGAKQAKTRESRFVRLLTASADERRL